MGFIYLFGRTSKPAVLKDWVIHKNINQEKNEKGKTIRDKNKKYFNGAKGSFK